MLERCDVPLSKSQIYDFILEKEYTTFLTLQEVFGELASSDLILEKTVANRTYLEITKEGKQTLEFFVNRINPAIREEIDDYLRQNSVELRNEASILGDYHRVGENEYLVELQAKENGHELMGISLTVPTEEMAQNMLGNWHDKNQEIYSFIFSKLISEE